MAEANPADTATETVDDTTETAEVDWKAEAEKWKTAARKHETRAKENAGAAKELEQLRQQTMTETEKAVAQAKAEGRAEALAQLAAAKVESAFAVAANGRIGADSLKVLLQGINHAQFLTDDGSVDDTSIGTFLDGIAPKPDPNRRVDLGQGARPGGNNGPGSGKPADPLEAALTAISKRT